MSPFHTYEPVESEQTAQVSMLGGFSLQMGERAVTDEVNRSLKLWSVLCYLIIHRNRAVPQSELIDVFWPEEDSANPLSALKVLLHRVRGILEPLFDKDHPPIVSWRGAYQWNPDIPCQVDAEDFEALCLQAQQWSDASAAQRMELYQEAVEHYKGSFLPKLSGHDWVLPEQTRYHGLYISAVKAYARLLEDVGQDLLMETLCVRASHMEPLDEELHILIIRAMMHQGKNAAALKHCEAFEDQLYRELGVRPSEELKNLQKKISAAEERVETDLDVIHAALREDDVQGAFVCEYEFFKAAYRLEVRRVIRSGGCLHMGLITMSMSDGTTPSLKVLNTAMGQLLDVIVHSLRQGDVVSKYSSTQFAVMLPYANLENSTMVMERILNSFRRQYKKSVFQLSYKLRELGVT